jgi:hypothetical protein
MPRTCSMKVLAAEVDLEHVAGRNVGESESSMMA